MRVDAAATILPAEYDERHARAVDGGMAREQRNRILDLIRSIRLATHAKGGSSGG